MNIFLIILFLSLAISVLSVIVILFTRFYLQLLKKLNGIQKQNAYLRVHMQEKGLQTLNNAKQKALTIIKEATNQAEDIIKATKFTEADASDSFKKELQSLYQKQEQALNKATESFSNSIEEELQKIQNEDNNMVQSAANSMQSIAEKKLESFEGQLRSETLGRQETIDEKIQTAFKQAQEEIDTYKKGTLDKVHTQIYAILSDVTKEVIGKRLSYDDHAELIKAKLEEAKGKVKLLET